MRARLVFLAILLSILTVVSPDTAVDAGVRPPRYSGGYCCSAFLDDFRPPRWWNGKVVQTRIPKFCRHTCGRR